MILICSNSGDLSAERINSTLLNKNIDTYNLFIDQYVSLSPQFIISDGNLINQVGVNLSNISAIYYRATTFPYLLNSQMPEFYRNFLNRELITLFLGQLMSINAIWINHPFYAHLSSYKIRQIAKAREMGLDVPDTCVSTDRQVLFDFYRQLKGKNRNVVTKAIHLGYVQAENSDDDEFIFTQEAVIQTIDELPKNNPILLQEKIDADYEIRCFIVGNQVLSAKLIIPKNCIDYRAIDSSEIKTEIITLPKNQVKACVELTHFFNLKYSAIDLLFCNGRYFFLDLNSTGEWLWYENNAQLSISDKIADVLIN